MRCGIHQGGFLSLLKYAAFIDPLLREIEDSGYVCRIINIPSSPVGYADDLSVCSLSKYNIDKVLDIVYRYSCRWRFYYNADKSAVMVYGENKRESCKNAKYRTFRLGSEKVKERVEYGHVGVKNCLYNDTTPRTEDRISRGRRAFHAISGIGVKNNGVCMNVCNTVVWSIIMPIVSYGAELWVLQPDEIEILRKFQRYIGRRCQRFPKRSPISSAVNPLGWISIDRYIKVKKLLFLRTILVMQEGCVCKRILVARVGIYRDNPNRCVTNENSSPIFDILNACLDFGILDKCLNMIDRGCPYSKLEWKEYIWDLAWRMEDVDYNNSNNGSLMYCVIERPLFLVWWMLSDLIPSMTRTCESMAKLVCDASLLKSNDYRLKNLSFSHKICNACYLGIREDIKHLVMQCPLYEGERTEMWDVLHNIDDIFVQNVISDPLEFFYIIMGKHPINVPFESMVKLWTVSGQYIARMYKHATLNRK